MASKFVKPETKVITLSDGDTITIRRRLNYGEQRSSFARLYTATTEGTMRVNPLETGRAMVSAYLLDWTLTDDEGEVVSIAGLTPEELGHVLDTLDPDAFREIRDAIEKHETEELTAREQEKKSPAGVSG